MPNALSELIHPGKPALCPINHSTHLSLHPEQPPFPRHAGGMLRLSPRGWVTRGGLHGRGGRWRECANPGHALPSPSRVPSAARSRPAPHAPVASPVACPMDPCHGASCSSGKALLPTQGARITAAPWSAGSHRLRGCHLQLEKKYHWNRLGITVRRRWVSQVISRGKEKAKQPSWKGENVGEWSSVTVEVSSSCDKRGKKAGKSPVCGFGDIRKVTLGMDVH